MHLLVVCAQVLIAASIAFVWVVHFPNIVHEFHEYGLSDLTRSAVGAAKITLATLLVAAIWYPALATVPALLMAFLMLCAIAAHLKAHHALQKSLPAAALLLLSLFVAYEHAGFLHR